jgi:hypothetical protein
MNDHHAGWFPRAAWEFLFGALRRPRSSSNLRPFICRGAKNCMRVIVNQQKDCQSFNDSQS